MNKSIYQHATIVFFVLLIITTTLSNSSEPDNYEIRFIGNNIIDNLQTNISEKWLGLFVQDGNYILKEVNADIVSRTDSVSNNTAAIYFQNVIVKDSVKPIILIGGNNNLSPGFLKSASFNKNKRLGLAEFLFIKFFRKQSGYLVAFGDAVDKENRFPGDVLIENYEIKYFDLLTNKSQSLAKYNRVTLEILPSLVWAGDLDGDKKLDLLMDLSANHGFWFALFLSSQANDGDFFKKVAEVKMLGC